MIRGKTKCGQYLSLEQMFLFVVSVVIMSLVYYAFSGFVGEAGSVVAEDQLKGVNELTLSGIYRAHNFREEHRVGDMEFRASIPKEISGETYKIIAENGKVRVFLDDGTEAIRSADAVEGEVNLTMDERFATGLSSRGGTLSVKLDGSEIIIGR